MILLQNNIKRAFKFIFKFRSHTAFSLVGLVIGLACVIIISAWTIEELRYDRFHRQADHIYMLTTDVKDNTGNVNRFPETPPPLAATLETQIPQIETGFHFLYLYGGRSIETEENTFKENGIAASPEFLEVFNFQLISGSAGELDEPNSIFLSKSLADKIFPNGNPIQKEILYKGDKLLVVRGVFKNVPRNSSLQFDFLIPYATEYGVSDAWWQLSDATFVKTSPSADITDVHNLMKEVWRENVSDEQFNIGIIPISDLRYDADFEFFNAEHGHGDRKKLFMFLGVAMIILILACLNYMNLISAYAGKRENETWTRKVHGASSANITNYFIIESVVLSVFAWGLATLLATLALRLFENLMGIVITPAYFNICAGLGLVISIIIVGLASAFYPAIRAGSDLLSNSNEGRKPNIKFQTNLRNAFVLSQFVISIALSICCLSIMRQANFMSEFETGYSKRNIIDFYMPLSEDKDISEIKHILDANPKVEAYSFGGASPVSLTVLNTIDKWKWEGLESDAHTSFYRIVVDEEFLNVFDMPMIQGRFFSSLGTDQNRIVINEALARTFGFKNPIGRVLSQGEQEYEIIGVVRDFNFQHLTSEIRPMVLTYSESQRHLFVKINSYGDETIGHLQKQIADFSDKPANYSFIMDDYDNLYKGEQQILSAILVFTIISILLSGLGLIGLITYSTEAKTKEIAVRKVFGAETREMMITLNLNILKMFVPGLILGCYIAWLFMRKWLEDYVYRQGLEWWIFLMGALIILVVAFLSVSLQTWKAAKLSPAVALKSQ